MILAESEYDKQMSELFERLKVEYADNWNKVEVFEAFWVLVNAMGVDIKGDS